MILQELADKDNWNLVHSRSYSSVALPMTPPTFKPIPPDNLIIDANIIQIAAGSVNAKPTWYVGCWVSVVLENNPSQLSGESEISRHTISLKGVSKLIQFPRYLPPRYKLLITFPKWIRDLSLEVWAFDGDQTSPEMEKLTEIIEMINP